MASGDHIEPDARALALPAGRRVGTPGHDEARRYVSRRLEQIGLSPFKGDSFELPYTHEHPENGRPTDFVNLAGIVRGAVPGAAPILVGAHYDSAIEAPSADDNAAAVAVALAVAEDLVSSQPRRDVIIAIFDAEEPPFWLSEAMGSTQFYKRECRDISFGCAIVMDLIGHDVENTSPEWDEPRPDLKDLLVVLGADTDKALPGMVECAAGRVDRLQVVPAHSRYLPVDMSDYHAFKENGQPYLFLTCGMGSCYHQNCDSFAEPGWLNIDKVRRVHRFVSQLVACADEIGGTDRTNGTDGTNGAGLGTSPRPVDPVDFEARMIHAALGDRLPLVGKGLQRLRTRQDLDRFAQILMPILLPLG